MTTIAYRDGVLAADTAVCQGGLMLGSMIKIVRGKNGDLAGSVGDAVFNWAFSTWFLGGEEGPAPEAKQEDSFDRGVIFRKSGLIDLFEPRGWFQASAPYFAFGSGREVALGAMFAGADAAVAVEAAIEFDPHSGGTVTVLRHD